MDNNPVQVPPTTPLQSPTESVKANGSRGILIFLVVLEVITLLLAGYFGSQYFQLKKQVASSQTTVTPTPVSATLSNEQPFSLPTGWSYKSDVCGVRFPIPPKEKPYYTPYDPNKPANVTGEENSGRFWDFPRGGLSPNLLSKFVSGNQEYKQAPTMYASASEASGYISQAVIVSCFNNFGENDNQAMLNTLKLKLEEYNQGTGEKGMQANKYTVQSSKDVNRWGKSVVDLVVSEYFENSGGQPTTNLVSYTMFTTPQYIYEVRVFGMTTDSFIKETAQKIFNGLVFE